MDEKAKDLLRGFVREKLSGEIGNLAEFSFLSLRGCDRFGCPGRDFDADDSELARAVCVVLWSDVLPGLSMDTLGNGKPYRGDTMNSFHTMFGREIEGRPGFYDGLEKFAPDDALRERVRAFSLRHCSRPGNLAVLPNRYVRGTTLNCYRGTNHWHDFFDRFLIQLEKVLAGAEKKDFMLTELVRGNAFCFDAFAGEAGFRTFAKALLLEDYCGADGAPRLVFPLNYHWKDGFDRQQYFRDADAYLEKAEKIIDARGRRMTALLKEKLYGRDEPAA